MKIKELVGSCCEIVNEINEGFYIEVFEFDDCIRLNISGMGRNKLQMRILPKLEGEINLEIPKRDTQI